MKFKKNNAKILTAGLLFLVFISGVWALEPKYGSAGNPIAVPLTLSHDYLRNTAHAAPDFWILSSFYIPQFNGYSCSAAAASMVMNGLLNAGKKRADEDKNLTQTELIAKVPDWAALVSEAGLNGRHGLTLAQLASFLGISLKAYGADSLLIFQHEAISADEKELKIFREYLSKNEKSGKDFILLHFVQDDLTLAKGGPYAHISPVGAYDEKKRKVLVFDVDREYYEPYWVSDEILLKAMAHSTKAFGKGGFVWVGPQSLK